MSLGVEGRRSLGLPGLVPRRALLARLRDGREVPLVTAVAPAGYGKTSVLAQWVGADRRASAWITLEERHDDPACLLGDLAQALQETEPIGSGLSAALRDRDPDARDRLLPGLLTTLERRGRPLTIVLDNVDALAGTESLEVLAGVAEHIPPGSQLALASRTEPALGLGRMRVHRDLIELRVKDLAMDRFEACALVRGAGVHLTDAQAQILVERTEGWPAGLSLAALSARDVPDMGAALSRFSGDDHVVASYLRDELLAHLSVEDITFLTGSSTLERLCGSLCDEVLERSGSTATLERLAGDGLLTPLDRSHEWHRCQRPVREMLLGQLRRNDPARERELHRRAGAWYAARGDLDGAIEHAVAAGDARRAGEMLWRNLHLYMSDGREETLQRWLSRIPSADISADPPLALTAAHCCLAIGDLRQADHWRRAGASALARSPARPHVSSLAAGAVLIEAAVGRHGVVRMGQDAARAYAMEDEDSPWRSLCCLLWGVADYLTGEDASAGGHFEEGAHLGAVTMPHVESLCLAQLAMLAVEESDLERASELIDRAQAQTERHGLSENPISALVYAASADVRSRLGRADQAKGNGRQATRLLGMLTELVPWFDAQTRIVLARALVRLADIGAARTLLAEGSRRARRVPDATALRVWLDEAWGQIEASATKALGGSATLTMAELRILRFLPTHLSFREIAGRLNVSTNTVKTQAQSVYGKLKASSRSEAVARASEIGLLVS